jgi:hypothetical protein
MPEPDEEPAAVQDRGGFVWVKVDAGGYRLARLMRKKGWTAATAPCKKFPLTYKKLVDAYGTLTPCEVPADLLTEPAVCLTGAEMIAAERQRQIEQEGWTPEHDDEHDGGDLARAAEAYAYHATQQLRGRKPSYGPLRPPPYGWPWHPNRWKPSDDPIRNLVKAGALIAAEIDRLQRKGDTDGE